MPNITLIVPPCIWIKNDGGATAGTPTEFDPYPVYEAALPWIDKLRTGQTDLAQAISRMRMWFYTANAIPAPNGNYQSKDPDVERWLADLLDGNAHMAQAAENFRGGIEQGILDASPAQELYAAENRKEPHNWLERWRTAGGRTRDRRMIALKADPVWAKISDFGHAHPPFAFGSGMDVRDVSFTEAKEMRMLSDPYWGKSPRCPGCGQSQ